MQRLPIWKSVLAFLLRGIFLFVYSFVEMISVAQFYIRRCLAWTDQKIREVKQRQRDREHRRRFSDWK